jgi:membrane protease YdiL (CAAX protease family)
VGSAETVTYQLSHWPVEARDALRYLLAENGVDAAWHLASFSVPASQRAAVDELVARLHGTGLPSTGVGGTRPPVEPALLGAHGAVPAGPSQFAAPPGWYADPTRAALWRWWDGARWTDYVGPQVVSDRGWFPRKGDHSQIARGGGLAVVGFFGGQALSLVLVLLAIWLGASSRSVGTLLLGELALWSGLFGACKLAVDRYGTGSLRDLGLTGLRWGDAGIGALAALVARVVTVVIAVVLLLLFSFDDLTRDTSITDRAGLSTLGAVVVAVIVVVGAPFFEELFFRGLVQGVLTRRYGGRLAISIQSVAFALVHYQVGMTRGQAILTLSMILPVGFLLGCLRWRYERLGPGIVAHAVFNAMAVAILLATL